MTIRFILYQVPKNSTEAKNLSDEMTMKYGSDGWSVAAVTSVGGGTALLFTLQK